jgi:hypothetical protein
MSNTNSIHRLTSLARLRRARWLSAAVCVMAAAAASAQVPMKAVTECLETGTDLVSLPGVAGGTLSATECRGCPTLRLRFDQHTRYYIGKEAVPYAVLREAASKGNLRLYVSYRQDNRTLTRLRLVAVGNAQ